MQYEQSKIQNPKSKIAGVLFDLGSTLQEYQHEDWDAIVAALNRDLYRYIASRGHEHKLPPLDAFIEIVSTSVQAHRSRTARTPRPPGSRPASR